MKKLWILWLMLLVLLPAGAARADAAYDWALECRNKLAGTTTVYRKDETVTEGAHPGYAAQYTMPGGTYIKTLTYSYEDRMWCIGFYRSGSYATGWVEHGTLADATVEIFFSDGSGMFVPEALYKDKAALQAYIDRLFPGKELYDGTGRNPYRDWIENPTPTPGPGESGGVPATSRPSGTKKPSSNSRPKATATPAPAPQVILKDGTPVAVLTLGAYTSTIQRDGEEQQVQTAELVFSEDAKDGKTIAYIYAPRTGKCTLRAKSGSKADKLGECEAGTLVPVLAYGRNYCRITYRGRVGYVKTSCLKFCDTSAAPETTGTLTYRGKDTGSATAYFRNGPDDDAELIVRYPVGTVVAVFGQKSVWYECEYDGVRGFVHKNFIRIDE